MKKVIYQSSHEVNAELLPRLLLLPPQQGVVASEMADWGLPPQPSPPVVEEQTVHAVEDTGNTCKHYIPSAYHSKQCEKAFILPIVNICIGGL